MPSGRTAAVRTRGATRRGGSGHSATAVQCFFSSSLACGASASVNLARLVLMSKVGCSAGRAKKVRINWRNKDFFHLFFLPHQVVISYIARIL